MRRRSNAKSAVLIADDHAIFRQGLAAFLRVHLALESVIEVADFEAALAALGDPNLQLAILDLSMPGLHGPHDLVRARQLRPDLPIAVLSASDQRSDMLAALAAGMNGYIIKSADSSDVVNGLRRILDGEIYAPATLASTQAGPIALATAEPSLPAPHLTVRQKEVLRLLVEGLSNKQIARRLDVAESTVKIHVGALFKALGVRSRFEAIAKAGRYAA